MKFQQIAFTLALSASVALSSCASKFTPAQRASLATVTIANTTVDPEAYEEPYGGDLAMRNNASNVPATGILGPLVGAAIGGAIAGTQNASFTSHNKSQFAAVQRNTPQNVGELMNARLKGALKNDPFFKNRLSASSGNKITSEVTSHRLIRLGKNNGGILIFAPQIYVDLYLKDSSGKSLAGKTYIGTGTTGYPIEEYAASVARTKQAYSDALDRVVLAFQADMAIKTAE
jgi:hypothetical protein